MLKFNRKSQTISLDIRKVLKAVDTAKAVAKVTLDMAGDACHKASDKINVR